jgi:hypothetical protein
MAIPGRLSCKRGTPCAPRASTDAPAPAPAPAPAVTALSASALASAALASAALASAALASAALASAAPCAAVLAAAAFIALSRRCRLGFGASATNTWSAGWAAAAAAPASHSAHTSKQPGQWMQRSSLARAVRPQTAHWSCALVLSGDQSRGGRRVGEADGRAAAAET